MNIPKLPWRSLLIFINVTTIITGFCTFMPLSYVTYYFLDHCVLFAKVAISKMNTTTLTVDMTKTKWGSQSDCRFPTYTPLVMSIHAFIWCWFFLLLKEQLKKDRQDLPMLIMSFLFHTVLVVVSFVVASMISAGMNTWCANLEFEISLKPSRLFFTCEQTQGLLWLNIFSDELHPTYTFLNTSKISSWLQTLTILCQSVASGYKLYSWVVGETQGRFRLDFGACRGFASPSSSNSAYVDFEQTDDEETFEPIVDDTVVDQGSINSDRVDNKHKCNGKMNTRALLKSETNDSNCNVVIEPLPVNVANSGTHV
ncbi:transmembrane protein 179-like [Mya arenaria]|uniref:transmembrane protein 179-like n=1 Tax=Mya arenaria TaxID=6604 RepID=UPI0022E5625B|nr:transmembrane protein 179-like [Mya arenaria]XP_052807385.1 transmembrane protein 179-like [Mya arenaria]XP_052807386.1 transmembrane protein 179-like [Mya arenaria]XP_052807387.1 transmembrane protein 179-like [Mya arenaria]XP_052807388.1 transmembrane protein 179-like [Mya arenaria]XP_052807389.1 transmembrane protein 179-like [Mya arenaria]XP_052807390.1 transmembrane protein 179-like [Mya arenaria]XP_052807391.1 transmembrane protein 179-like [Mya arenaria]